MAEATAGRPFEIGVFVNGAWIYGGKPGIKVVVKASGKYAPSNTVQLQV